MKRLFIWGLRSVFFVGLILLGTIVFLRVTTKPSNIRDWNVDQAILPYADIQDKAVKIHNIRNFTYTSTSTFTPGYYDKTFDLTKIKRVWYIVEPFSGFRGSAHTFLSFEFEGNQFVSISVEIRKEKGESFSAVKGLFNKYELMYVIASEMDVVKLRSNFRKDQVYVYPVKTTQEKARSLFLDMIARTNKLKEQPEFYNSLLNNCTTNIAEHVNKVTPDRVPMLSLQLILPENSDALALKLGLIDTTLSLKDARDYYRINERAEKAANDPEFSIKIRPVIK